MCNPIAIIAGASAVFSAGSSLSAAEDQEDAYHAQSQSALANAQHRKEVSIYNAGIFTTQADRLRDEQVTRINEAAGINISRLGSTRDTNIERLETSRDVRNERLDIVRNTGINRFDTYYDTQTGRLTETQEREGGKLNSDLVRTVGRWNTDRYESLDEVNRNSVKVSGRLNDGARLASERIVEDAIEGKGRISTERDIAIDRTKGVTDDAIKADGKEATETATAGFEEESGLRSEVNQEISSNRVFYGAGNVVIDSGTPASLRMDSQQQGEVSALRIRRDYRIRVENLEQNAKDSIRDALFQIDGLKRQAGYDISDIDKESSRSLFDVGQTTAWQLEDLYEQAGYDIADINKQANRGVNDVTRLTARTLDDLNRTTSEGLADLKTSTDDQKYDLNFETDLSISDNLTATADQISDINSATDLQLDDINRNLGYDLSDVEFEADKLDQQAALTLIQGNADYAAGVNQADAFDKAGNDAITNGVLNAVATGVGVVADSWYSNANTPVQVSTSTPAWTNPNI